MKVTALLPDTLIADLRHFAGGETLTEALSHALKAWVAREKIRQLNAQVGETPLEFQKGFSSESVRHLNRRR